MPEVTAARSSAILAAVWLAALLSPSPSVAAGITFNVTPGPGLSALQSGTPLEQTFAANMLTGFNQAAGYWQAIFNDPITVNYELDWQALGPGGPLASASSNKLPVLYTDVRTALTAERTSADDYTSVANLTANSAIAGYTNMRNGTRYLNSGSDTANTTLSVPSANLKAIGLLPANDPALDATITFSDEYAFSFNHGSIALGHYDYVGIVIHEIGHALGFTSGVDGVDQFTGAGPYASVDLNGSDPGIGDGSNQPIFSILDLNRHSTDAPGTLLDLSTNGPIPFFSLDGTTSIAPFSTGRYNGNGWQASHWRPVGYGVMNPYIADGESQNIGPNDIRALDVIGYNLVPEPSTFLLLALAVALVFPWRFSLSARGRRPE
jgi:hypothetical protein